MKKILFLNLLMFSFVMGVNADTITFNELPNKLKESLTYEEFLEEGITCDIATTDDSLDITCDLKSDGVYTTHFDYDGSVLSYNSDAEVGSVQKVFDSLWILQLTDNVNGVFGVEVDNVSIEDAFKGLYLAIYEVNNSSTFSMNIERGYTVDSGDTGSGSGNTGTDNNDNTGTGNGNTGTDNNDNTGTGNGSTGTDNNDNTGTGNGSTGTDNNDNTGTGSGNTGTGDGNVNENPQTGNIVIFVIVVIMLGSIVSIILYKNYLGKSNEI